MRRSGLTIPCISTIPGGQSLDFILLDLANRVGASREMMSRILKDLTAGGIHQGRRQEDCHQQKVTVRLVAILSHQGKG
jgi:hypothetical protein